MQSQLYKQVAPANMQSSSNSHTVIMSMIEGVVVLLGGTVVVEVTRTVLAVTVTRVDGVIVVISTTVDVETGTGRTVVVSIAVDVETGTEEVLELLELLLEETLMVEVTKDVDAAVVVSKRQPVRG